MKKVLLVLTLIASFLACASAKADDLGDLKAQIKLQQEMLDKMQNKLDRVESQQVKQQETFNKIEYSPNNSGSVISLAKSDKLKIGGDFRLRYERIDQDSKERVRNRSRIRARVNMKYKINDNTDFDLRVATGSDDPVSTNQTLDDGFTSKELWLDRAYLTWRPNDNMKIFAGKMANPFYKVGKNQLIWDGDLNPEGIAFNYDFDLSDNTSGFVNGGAFYVQENSSSSDVSLWGIQGALKNKFNETSSILGGLGYYDYHNMKGHTLFYEDKSFGNSYSGTNYTSDYNLFEVFGEYKTKFNSTPFTAYGNWVRNLNAISDADTAWLVGCKYNKASKPGTWQMDYDYRDVDADSVVALFNDSDFMGGKTDSKGHRFGAAYQVAKNVQVGVTHFINENKSTGDKYNRTQLDVKIKF